MSLLHEGEPRQDEGEGKVETIVDRIITSTTVKTWPEKAQDDFRKGFICVGNILDKRFRTSWNSVVAGDVIRSLRKNPDNENEDPLVYLKTKIVEGAEGKVSPPIASKLVNNGLETMIKLFLNPPKKRTKYVLSNVGEELRASAKRGNSLLEVEPKYDFRVGLRPY